MIIRNLSTCIKHLIKNESYVRHKKLYSTIKPPWSIMFFGTDDFSVSSLNCLNNELKRGSLIQNLEVVTSTKAKVNPVRTFANKENLLVHDWPIRLLDQRFHIGIVVSFGHLIPEDIINHFPLGVINVHASLLPRWRGAAPIIHAIAHGDKETGVTIMKIKPKKFDIGEIIRQKSVNIPEDIIMPHLYSQLAQLGASVLISCIKELPNCLHEAKPQPNSGVTYAPKITSNMAQINWEQMSAKEVYALGRALNSLFPLTTTWKNSPVKLYDIATLSVEESDHFNTRRKTEKPGVVEYHKKSKSLCIKCSDGKWITVKKIGLMGKKPMTATDFDNGYVKKELVENRIFK